MKNILDEGNTLSFILEVWIKEPNLRRPKIRLSLKSLNKKKTLLTKRSIGRMNLVHLAIGNAIKARIFFLFIYAIFNCFRSGSQALYSKAASLKTLIDAYK